MGGGPLCGCCSDTNKKRKGEKKECCCFVRDKSYRYWEKLKHDEKKQPSSVKIFQLKRTGTVFYYGLFYLIILALLAGAAVSFIDGWPVPGSLLVFAAMMGVLGVIVNLWQLYLVFDLPNSRILTVRVRGKIMQACIEDRVPFAQFVRLTQMDGQLVIVTLKSTGMITVNSDQHELEENRDQQLTFVRYPLILGTHNQAESQTIRIIMEYWKNQVVPTLPQISSK